MRVVMLFAALLIAGIVAGIWLPLTLLAGLVLFAAHARVCRKLSLKEIVRACAAGLKTAGLVVVLFVFIGALTAAWRASGTIAQIVTLASWGAAPFSMPVITFAACLVMTVCIGSSFAVASTVGVICALAGTIMGVPLPLLGGAMLTACYLGERLSPVSGSMILVAQIAGVSHDALLRKTAPLSIAAVLVCGAAYLVWGIVQYGISGVDAQAFAWMGSSFSFGWPCLVPVAVLVTAAALRLDVRVVLAAGMVSAGAVAVLYQGMPLDELARALVMGYQPEDETLRQTFAGGGVLSMVSAMLVVGISSCYTGLFDKTGVLGFLEQELAEVATRAGFFAACLLGSVVTSMVACNQTLAIMLTHQLCKSSGVPADELATRIVDSALVMAPLVPWSIAGLVPLAAVGAGAEGIPFACGLLLIPLVRWVMDALPATRRAGLRPA